ncbi:MAG: hypothetical protein ACRCWI_03080 [Brevinema sp.]
MKKMLIMLLLSSSPAFADFKKVKEINGIKIPKGVIAQYDDLENEYLIGTDNFYKFEGFNGVHNHITLHYTYKNDVIYPCIELSINTTSRDMKPLFKTEVFIDVDSVTIFIRNKGSDVKKYTVDWSEKSTTKDEFQKYNVVSVREFTKKNDVELFNFLLENIDKDSAVTVRFQNTKNNTKIDADVKKRELKDLFNMLQLYKLLNRDSTEK